MTDLSKLTKQVDAENEKSREEIMKEMINKQYDNMQLFQEVAIPGISIDIENTAKNIKIK